MRMQRTVDYCRELTQQSGTSFYYAFLFLPRERREGLYAIYAFCRLIDDIVDGDVAGVTSEAQKRAALAGWRQELDWVFAPAAPGGGGAGDAARHHPVAAALRQLHRRFGLHKEDALAVIDGCEMDLTQTTYPTWEALRGYCYRVASAVGLLCIDVFGHSQPAARDYAIELGLALQLTNIIRDVAEDAARGRIYLPLADLRACGVSEADLLAGRRSAEVMRLLRQQAARAHQHYRRARALLPEEDRRSLLVAEIMGDIYHALLRKIERSGFAVLPPGGKIQLRRHHKLAIALTTVSRSLLLAA